MLVHLKAAARCRPCEHTTDLHACSRASFIQDQKSPHVSILHSGAPTILVHCSTLFRTESRFIYSILSILRYIHNFLFYTSRARWATEIADGDAALLSCCLPQQLAVNICHGPSRSAHLSRGAKGVLYLAYKGDPPRLKAINVPWDRRFRLASTALIGGLGGASLDGILPYLHSACAKYVCFGWASYGRQDVIRDWKQRLRTHTRHCSLQHQEGHSVTGDVFTFIL